MPQTLKKSFELLSTRVDAIVDNLAQELHDDDESTDWRKGREIIPEDISPENHNPRLDEIVNLVLEATKADPDVKAPIQALHEITNLLRSVFNEKKDNSKTSSPEDELEHETQLSSTIILLFQLLSVRLNELRLKTPTKIDGEANPISQSVSQEISNASKIVQDK